LEVEEELKSLLTLSQFVLILSTRRRRRRTRRRQRERERHTHTHTHTQRERRRTEELGGRRRTKKLINIIPICINII